jgi:GT2 family glycosyltransferase
MLVKRDLYQELGGFDENCFMYSDDVDLSYRMLLKGKSNYYPETTVIHYKVKALLKMVYETVSGIYAVFLKNFKVSVFFRFYENRMFFFLLKCFRVKPKKKRHLNPVFVN